MSRYLKRAWEFAGIALGAFTMYRQLVTLNEMRNEVLANLSPEEQAAWRKYYSTLQTPLVKPIQASDIAKIEARV